MANITLRPDLRTAGGEVSDILLDGKYAGTLTLVYREGSRIAGAIQLEQPSLTKNNKRAVTAFVRSYVQSMIDAIQAIHCDVVVTYSAYDHVIATDDSETTWYETDDSYVVGDEPDEIDNVSMRPNKPEAVYYELVQVGKNRNQIEYHVYDERKRWIAEALFAVYETDVVGVVNWKMRPDDEAIENITDLIVSDYNEDAIDTFIIDMNYQGETFETIELAHEDIADALEQTAQQDAGPLERDIMFGEDYSIVLARDDGDTLTYDIYQQSYGGLPIGNATVDISSRQMTGFIDFREPGSAGERENIAALLMRELDKEREFDSFNLTMLYDNEPIDELHFENEAFH